MMARILQYCLALALLFSISPVFAQENQMGLCDTDIETVQAAPSVEARAMLVLNSLQSGDTTATENYVSADAYTQHNLGVADGRDALLGLIPGAAQAGSTVNIKRVLVSGNIVALHTEYNLPMFGGAFVGFDVFRFEDGVIVEHWDNLIPVAEPNPSRHTQTDGPVAITDLDKTQENCAKVVEFITKSLVASDPSLDITQYISPVTYTQHNPQVADGLEGFGAVMQAMAQNNQVMGYSKIHFVVAQGNFVLTASEGVFGDKNSPTSTAFYDLFRLEDDLIVEHWDVISPIPPQAEWQNQNGKF